MAIGAVSAMLSAQALGAIIINEVVYDDGGTDDREFVELYNNGAAPVDISGWTLTGRDSTTVNATNTVPAATTLNAGDYYVFGLTNVLNVDQVIASTFLENDAESVEIRDAGGAL